MTRVYAVTYELATSQFDYSGLNEELISSLGWGHYLKSMWLVATDENADALWRRLKPHLGEEDFLLVIEVGPDCQGWLPADAWDWIRENLPAPSVVPAEAVGV